MSVTERIREIQEAEIVAKQQAQRLAQEAARIVLEKQTETLKIARTIASKESKAKKIREEQRRQFVKQQTVRVFNESGVLTGLHEIENEFLKNRRAANNKEIKCGIIENIEYGTACLVWGHGIGFGKDRVRTYGTGWEYSSIEIRVDPDKDQLTIESKNFGKKQYKNKELMEGALATAFLSPSVKKYEPPEPEPVEEKWYDDQVNGQDSGGR